LGAWHQNAGESGSMAGTVGCPHTNVVTAVRCGPVKAAVGLMDGCGPSSTLSLYHLKNINTR
jgi:hypothetical protein